ncbi:MAG: hypothetical protein PSY14_00370 [bacterium]|nr:hypothetical protein [bacterium]
MSKAATVMIAAFSVVTAIGGANLWEAAEATNATTTLKNEGYTDVKVTRGERFKTAAPVFTLYAAPFTAKDAAGNDVKGEVTRNLGKPVAFQLKAG